MFFTYIETNIQLLFIVFKDEAETGLTNVQKKEKYQCTIWLHKTHKKLHINGCRSN